TSPIDEVVPHLIVRRNRWQSLEPGVVRARPALPNGRYVFQRRISGGHELAGLDQDSELERGRRPRSESQSKDGLPAIHLGWLRDQLDQRSAHNAVRAIVLKAEYFAVPGR